MRQRLVILAVGVLLLVLIVSASLYLADVQEDDSLAGLADALEPVTGRIANVIQSLNPSLRARADAVAASLQAQVPADTADRAGFIGACLAAWRNESQLHANIFNYYDDEKKLHVGYYPDDPNWQRVWGGGIAGLLWKFAPGWGATDKAQLFDLDWNVGTSIRRINLPHWKRIMRQCAGLDLHMRAALLYLGHAAGGVPMDAGIPVAAAGGDWSAVVEASRGAHREGQGDPRRQRIWTVTEAAAGYAAEYGGA